jgi:hypothetical protein
MDYFSNLTDDNIKDIALQLDIDKIDQFCQTSQKFNNSVCNNQYFWYQKLINDYGNIGEQILADYKSFYNNEPADWKYIYLYYDNVLVIGENSRGQLGLYERTMISIPTLLQSFSFGKIKFKSISCGNGHTVMIDIDNNLWGIGFNKYGQLGLNNIVGVLIPKIIPNIKANSVSCGNEHTIIMFELLVQIFRGN